uniref:SFRICE_005951 n=1 Tax=Spodoptera frugiperda TaxID=7108 RepID=A0A2H1W532_SPOFR
MSQARHTLPYRCNSCKPGSTLPSDPEWRRSLSYPEPADPAPDPDLDPPGSNWTDPGTMQKLL